MNYKKIFDNYYIGIIISLLLPTILFIIIYVNKKEEYELVSRYVENYFMIKLPRLISRCVFPNVIAFIIFMYLNYYKAVKGTLYTTMALTIVMFIIKYILNNEVLFNFG